jgi:MFS family permease
MKIRKTLLVFLLLGLVSLFADITYEGARSVLGPYVEILGGTALIAGALTIGDFIGYSARLLTGVIVGYLRSSRVLWFFTIFGYLVNLLSVPALAFVGSWKGVLALVILERTGKGLRTPARDVVLAEVSENIGMGKGFGIHELLDQLGAITGPIVVSLVLGKSGYREAFKLLALPAVIAITLIITTSLLYPDVKSVGKRPTRNEGSLTKGFFMLLVGISLLSIGFLHWSIISYYIKNLRLVPDTVIPLLYTIAMGVDAVVALIAGILYDKVGIKVLMLAPLLAFPIPVILSLRFFSGLLIVSILWGSVLGLYETVMKASVAEMVPPGGRAYAFGIYNFVFGMSWLAGSLLAGALYTPTLNIVRIVFPLIALASLAPLASLLSSQKNIVQ